MKPRMPPGPGPTCRSRRSPWTPARIRYDLAFTYFNLAVMLRDIGRTAEAAEGFGRRSITWAGWFASSQTGPFIRHLLAKTHYELGLLASQRPDRPRGRVVAKVPGLVRGAGPRASRYLGLPIQPGTQPAVLEPGRRRSRPAGRGRSNPPVRPGYRGEAGPRAPGVERHLLRSSPGLSALLRERSSRTGRGNEPGRPEDVCRSSAQAMPSACWKRPRRPATSAFRRASSS